MYAAWWFKWINCWNDKDSSEESEDDDVSYIPLMSLKGHYSEEDMNEISDDNIICGQEDAIICKELYLIFQYFYFFILLFIHVFWS